MLGPTLLRDRNFPQTYVASLKGIPKETLNMTEYFVFQNENQYLKDGLLPNLVTDKHMILFDSVEKQSN